MGTMSLASTPSLNLRHPCDTQDLQTCPGLSITSAVQV